MLPEIQNPDEKQRTIDELPQSASGRLVMTTEPKFIQKQGAKITFQNKVDFLQSIVEEMVLIDNDEIKELCLDNLKHRVVDDITEFVDNVELTDYLCAINDEVKFQDYVDSEYENKLNELIDSFKINKYL